MNSRKYPPCVCPGRLTKSVKRELYNILKTNENNEDFGVPAFFARSPRFPLTPEVDKLQASGVL